MNLKETRRNIHPNTIFIHQNKIRQIYIWNSTEYYAQYRSPTDKIFWKQIIFYKKKIVVGFINNWKENAAPDKFVRSLERRFFSEKWRCSKNGPRGNPDSTTALSMIVYGFNFFLNSFSSFIEYTLYIYFYVIIK